MENRDSEKWPELQQAFTLLELTIAMGVLGVLALAVSLNIVNTNNITGNLSQIAAIDQLFLLLRDTLMNENAIANSLNPPNVQAQQINQSLLNCLQGLVLYNWSQYPCNNGQSYSFILYNQNPVLANSLPLTGYKGVTAGNYDPTLDQPKMYTLSGGPCVLGEPACLVQVTTGFKSFCGPMWFGPGYIPPGNGSDCPIADFIEFDLTVSSLPNPSTGQPAFPPLNWTTYYSHIDSTVNNPSRMTWDPPT